MRKRTKGWLIIILTCFLASVLVPGTIGWLTGNYNLLVVWWIIIGIVAVVLGFMKIIDYAEDLMKSEE